MQAVEFDGFPSGLVVETFVVWIEAGRYHVGPLLLHQLAPLGEATIGDAVLDDAIAVAGDVLAKFRPARDVEIAQPRAVGLNLFVASHIAKMGLTEVSIACLPWVFVLLAYLVLITYVPAISLWLPNLLY